MRTLTQVLLLITICVVLLGSSVVSAEPSTSNATDGIGDDIDAPPCIDLGVVKIRCDEDEDARDDAPPTTTTSTTAAPTRTSTITKTENPTETSSTTTERADFEGAATTQTPTQTPTQTQTPTETSTETLTQTPTTTERTTPIATPTETLSTTVPDSTATESTAVSTTSTIKSTTTQTASVVAETESQIEAQNNASVGASTPDKSDPSPAGFPGLPVIGILTGAGLVGYLYSGSTLTESPNWQRMVAGARNASETLLDRLFGAVGWLCWVIGASRSEKQRLLEHDIRRAIYETITDNPGITLADVHQETEIPRTTIETHAKVLWKSGVLHRDIKRYGKRHYYPEEEIPGEAMQKLIAVEEHETRAAVLAAIPDSGAATPNEIAASIGRESSTVSHHINRLESDGLIEREQDGRTTMISLQPNYAAIINRFLE